jgi:ubiquinone/menaquinone biosynthesis C-methylase UbiE
MSDSKTEVICQIVLSRISCPSKVLVVGCGSGLEAATISRVFEAKVTGIDIEPDFSPEAARQVELRVADATQMPFSDGSFDFVYSYHVLEHIPDFRKALREIGRVLSPEGHWIIGVPNRSRLLGYIGSNEATLTEKLAWNLSDWKMRLMGRFTNEHGAHAGFTSSELSKELSDIVGPPEDVTLEYYKAIYSRHTRKLMAVSRTGSGRFIFPSIYFFGSVHEA